MAYPIATKDLFLQAFNSQRGLNSGIQEIPGLLGTTVEGLGFLEIDASAANQADANSLYSLMPNGVLFQAVNHPDSAVVFGIKSSSGTRWLRDNDAVVQDVYERLAGKAGETFNITLNGGAVSLPTFAADKSGRFEIVFKGVKADGTSETGTVNSLFNGSGQPASTVTVGNRDSVTLTVENGSIVSAAHIDRKETEAASFSAYGLTKIFETLAHYNAASTDSKTPVSANVLRQLIEASTVQASQDALRGYLKKVRDLSLAGLTTTNGLTDVAIDAMTTTEAATALGVALSELHVYFSGKVTALEDAQETAYAEGHNLVAAYTLPTASGIAKITTVTTHFSGDNAGHVVTYPKVGGGTDTGTFYRGGFIQVRYNKDGSVASVFPFTGTAPTAVYDDTALAGRVTTAEQKITALENKQGDYVKQYDGRDRLNLVPTSSVYQVSPGVNLDEFSYTSQLSDGAYAIVADDGLTYQVDVTFQNMAMGNFIHAYSPSLPNGAMPMSAYQYRLAVAAEKASNAVRVDGITEHGGGYETGDTSFMKPSEIRGKALELDYNIVAAASQGYRREGTASITGSSIIKQLGAGASDVRLKEKSQLINGVTIEPYVAIVFKNNVNAAIKTGDVAVIEATGTGDATSPIELVYSFEQARQVLSKPMTAQTNKDIEVKFEEKDKDGNVIKTKTIQTGAITFAATKAGALLLQNAINDELDGDADFADMGFNYIFVDSALNVRLSVAKSVEVSIMAL